MNPLNGFARDKIEVELPNRHGATVKEVFSAAKAEGAPGQTLAQRPSGRNGSIASLWRRPTTSDLLQKTDVVRASEHVSIVPKAESERGCRQNMDVLVPDQIVRTGRSIDPTPGHACVRLPTNTRHFTVLRYLACRAVFRCGRSRYREAASPSSFCAANSVNSFISGIRERSSVSTSGQSISIRFPAGSRKYIWTQPSGSSFTGLRNAVELSAPIAFAAS